MNPPNRIARSAVSLALAAGLVAGLAACQTPLDRAYGRSQREFVARMIENPEAGAEGAAVLGDGASTGAALTKHREAERATDEGQPQSVININTN